MKNNKRVLFAGNGVAMQIGAANKWGDIISEFAKEYAPQLDGELLKKLPYNMQIVAATQDNVDKSMVKLCQKLREITLNEEQKVFGKRILSLPFDRIITTNYTYELERSVSENKVFRCRYSQKHKESDMTLFGHIPVNIGGDEKQIWHIHGHACAPNSVIMGHYFYGKLVFDIIVALIFIIVYALTNTAPAAITAITFVSPFIFITFIISIRNNANAINEALYKSRKKEKQLRKSLEEAKNEPIRF